MIYYVLKSLSILYEIDIFCLPENNAILLLHSGNLSSMSDCNRWITLINTKHEKEINYDLAHVFIVC